MKKQTRNKLIAGSAALFVFIIGALIVIRSSAASSFASIEAESGTVSGGASVVTDTQASGSKALAFSAATTTPTPTPTPTPSQQPYWTADWEEGPCTDISCYTDWSFVQAEDASSPANPDLNEVALASKFGITAHSGTKVGKFETTLAAINAGQIHSKVFKEWQFPGSTTKKDDFGRNLQALPATGINGTYRAWFYVPADYTYAGKGWTNIFQFKLSEENPFVQDPQWWVNIIPGSGSAPEIFVNHWKGNVENNTKPLPRGRWFEIRADVYESSKIDWYLDGQFWQTVQNSTWKIGKSGATGKPQSWVFGVGHYDGVGKIYTDDASFTPF